jgi:ParB/RepB/Spo0J family partition protein
MTETMTKSERTELPRDPMSIDIFDIPPHPAAEVFPLLPDDELEELALDIKDNGLQQPLVVAKIDGQMVLIDGRNRREACRRAGIIPDHVLLDGADPVAYIVSANINRRHMTKGQRAMVVARICFETKQSIRDGAKQSGISAGRLGYAMAVINHAPDLAPSVLAANLRFPKVSPMNGYLRPALPAPCPRSCLSSPHGSSIPR